MQRAMSSGSRPRIVIIGAGFAGLAAAKALRKAQVDLIVIDLTTTTCSNRFTTRSRRPASRPPTSRLPSARSWAGRPTPQ